MYIALNAKMEVAELLKQIIEKELMHYKSRHVIRIHSRKLSTLTMKTVGYSETSENIYQSTRHCVPESRSL